MNFGLKQKKNLIINNKDFIESLYNMIIAKMKKIIVILYEDLIRYDIILI